MSVPNAVTTGELPASVVTSASVPRNVRIVTVTDSPVTAAAGDFVLANATGGAITVNLPASASGSQVVVKKTDSSANAVAVVGTIDGASNASLVYQNQGIALEGDGSAYQRVVRQSLATGIVDYPATPDARYVRQDGTGMPLSVVSAASLVWTPSTAYVTNQLVLQGGVLYAATTNFTSGASFGADGANWVPVSSGELGYAELTSSADAPAVLADVPGLTITVTVGTRPIKLVLDAQNAQISTAGNFGVAAIYEGATQLATVQWGGGAANEAYPLHRERRLAPSAGSHTYNVKSGLVLGTHGANDRISAVPSSPFSLSCHQV